MHTRFSDQTGKMSDFRFTILEPKPLAIDHRNLPAVRNASALIRAVRTAGPLLWTIATLRAKKTLACPDNI